MKKSHLFGAAITYIAIFTTPQAMSLTIDTYFGWNYVSSAAFFTNPPNDPIPLPTLQLDSITYLGAGGSVTQTMPAFPGYGNTMPDGEGLGTKPTVTYTLGGDGETTRTVATSLPIDWIEAGIMTPWGVTYSFPTIGITNISAQGFTGEAFIFTGFCIGAAPGATFPTCTGGIAVPTGTTATQHVVGLIPVGANTELDSSLGGFQSDIYDPSQQVSFRTDPLSGVTAIGGFIFSAAAVSIPPTVVSIDIKPGSDPAPINLKSKGVTPIAILTTNVFNAMTVDSNTICFGDVDDPAGNGDCTEAHGKDHFDDVDGDGDLDMVLHFETRETGIESGDEQACLIGMTFEGENIEGCDDITVK